MTDQEHYSKTREFHRVSAIEREGYYDARDGKPLRHSRWQRRIRNFATTKITSLFSNDATLKSLADIGCGKGDYVAELAKKVPADRLVGADFTPETLELARKINVKDARISFHEADILNLPFEDGEFDCVTCINVLHHILDKDEAKALSELARVADKYVLIEIKNAANFYYKHVASKSFAGIRVYPTTENLVAREMEKSGFKLCDSIPIFRFKFLSPLILLVFQSASV